MRLRIVFLLVLALVFKGWVGEAMAGQMVTQQLEHAAMAECPGHAGSQDQAPGHSSCEQCQACSFNALPATPVVLAAASPLPFAAPAVVRFASADTRQGRKPPVL